MRSCSDQCVSVNAVHDAREQSLAMDCSLRFLFASEDELFKPLALNRHMSNLVVMMVQPVALWVVDAPVGVAVLTELAILACLPILIPGKEGR